MKNNKMAYTESHKGKNYGLKYDYNLYNKDTYDNRIWVIEQNILNENLRHIDKSQDVLDFACGTGRVTKFIESLDFFNIYGFDVSKEMLKIANNKLKRTKLINIDINTEDINKYKNKFKIITAFRFFLNAENELKNITFNNIHKLLKEDGYLIFNIHGNKKSLRFFYVMLFNIKKTLINYILKRKEHIFTYQKQLSVSEVKKYLIMHNFEIVEIVSYSFLPKICHFILSKNVFIYIESRLVSKKFLCGTHLIFVVKKK